MNSNRLRWWLFRVTMLFKQVKIRRWRRGVQTTTCLAVWMIGLAVGGHSICAQSDTARARRPNWHTRDTSDIFFTDAFRDAFAGKSPFQELATPAAAKRHDPPTTPHTEVFHTERWAGVLDGPLLIDEIKAIDARCQKHTRSARSFAGESRDEARRGFLVAAVLFGILDEWQGDIRFKKQSIAASRRLFDAAFAIADPSTDALDLAKRASADLTDLVRGNPAPPPDTDRPKWRQLVKRDDVMWRLDAAVEESISRHLDSQQALKVHRDDLAREANLVIALLMALRQEGVEDADRADYVDYCRSAQQEAMTLRSAIGELDLTSSKRALQKLRQSCESCHEAYQ
jgi:hypothetical protein